MDRRSPNVGELNEKEKEDLRLKSPAFIFPIFNLMNNYTAWKTLFSSCSFKVTAAGQPEKKTLLRFWILGLKALADLYPQVLSGGEQQRIAAGRP